MNDTKQAARPAHIEASYPITFRAGDAKVLGGHLRLRHNVELVGAKRVGISNFLRFFLYHKDIVSHYIDPAQKHLLIAVDLNDMVEIDVFAFWILTFKRLADIIEIAPVSDEIKKDISALFLDAIQSRHIFLAVEGLRKALVQLVHEGILPTFFFLRFDRLAEVVNREMFANFVGLREATAQKVAYVFTSFRALDEIAPEVFLRRHLSVFSHPVYIKPATQDDTQKIFETYEARYNFSLAEKVKQALIDICSGHVQYLHLSLIVLGSRIVQKEIDKAELVELLKNDERTNLQSEEIWESLTVGEKKILLDIQNGVDVADRLNTDGKYLINTGLIRVVGREVEIFSLLFESYLASKIIGKQENGKVDFTKKENALFGFLMENKDNVCERESIIENVWPESEEMGVSDWTIDRLVARVRTKLTKQNSKYSIVTVKTRGYRLTENK